MKKPSFFPVLVGTGFGSGFSPFAPSTAGALLATFIWLGLSLIVSKACLVWLTMASILFFTILGIWAVNRLGPYQGEDPSCVVVDGMVGAWIALLAAPSGSVWYGLGAFALFRLLDISKPLGIHRMGSFSDGFGVMMDDILAGIYSFVVLIGVRWLIGWKKHRDLRAGVMRFESLSRLSFRRMWQVLWIFL